MRKVCLCLFIGAFLLMVSYSFAQQPRGNIDLRDNPNSIQDYPPSEGLTLFTNIGVKGLNTDGVPGYIEMISSSGKIFYLYVDDVGSLRIASPGQVATTASPNTTDWNNKGARVGNPESAG